MCVWWSCSKRYWKVKGPATIEKLVGLGKNEFPAIFCLNFETGWKPDSCPACRSGFSVWYGYTRVTLQASVQAGEWTGRPTRLFRLCFFSDMTLSRYGQKSNYVAIASYYCNASPMCFPALMCTNYFCLCFAVMSRGLCQISDSFALVAFWAIEENLTGFSVKLNESCTLCFGKSISW